LTARADRHVPRAAAVIRKGGIVAHATEGVFGFACDPRKRRALTRLLRLKRRLARKGFILIAADEAQLTPFCTAIPARAHKSWPGPHTWLLTPRAGLSPKITGRSDRIAVRVTAHRQAAALCRAAGTALVSTSANRSNEAPARTFRDAVRRFGRHVDYVLPGRTGGLRGPTPIADAATGRIIRA
jgi:L-threonylcarbamoyladenylate synthase